jgi:hypothetical protein
LNRRQLDLQSSALPLVIQFKPEEIEEYLFIQCNGLAKGSIGLIRQVMTYLMERTQGNLSKKSLMDLSREITNNGKSFSTNHKHYVYINNFIKHLSQARDTPAIATLSMYFRMPKTRTAVKLMTCRIMHTEDIANATQYIKDCTTLTDYRKHHFTTLLHFLAYSGQRPITVSRLTVGQFRKALEMTNPVLTVEANQDKLRMAHYVPLHPAIVGSLSMLIASRSDESPMFELFPFQRFLRLNSISLMHTDGKLELKDMRKFFEQKSDEIGFTDANKNFIMSHGVSSIGWTSYKQFLPENVYKKYLECWENVVIITRAHSELPLQESNLRSSAGNGIIR